MYKYLKYRLAYFFAGIFLSISLLFCVAVGVGVYKDYSQTLTIHSIVAEDVKPGKTTKLTYLYDRHSQPRGIRHISRRLTCEDGTVWLPKSVYDVEAAARGSYTVWPTGESQTVTLRIRIPEKVTADQTCFFSTHITYKTYISAEIPVVVPAFEVPIKIIK